MYFVFTTVPLLLITILVFVLIFPEIFPPLKPSSTHSSQPKEDDSVISEERSCEMYCTRRFLYSEDGLTEYVVLKPLSSKEIVDILYRNSLKDLDDQARRN
ncbi:hypothetical protein AVEN_50341-1 [Araneus ventricosus]|uniref:Uncharacterized protein n=1 Tax=Araneus ventricosus TaxID=182803 RepID=A0A4Y2EAF0_ARAVE|nr:hypothetical protein AVEN_50341-1 [Araneus ventricosus]